MRGTTRINCPYLERCDTVLPDENSGCRRSYRLCSEYQRIYNVELEGVG